MEFRPAEEWLNKKGIEADSLVLIADKIPTLKIPQGNNLKEWSLTKSNIQLTTEAKSIKLMESTDVETKRSSDGTQRDDELPPPPVRASI